VPETNASEEAFRLSSEMVVDAFISFKASHLADTYEAKAHKVRTTMQVVSANMERQVSRDLGAVAVFQPIRAIRVRIYERRAQRAMQVTAEAKVRNHERGVQLDVARVLLEADEILGQTPQD
jgi:D-alanyl-D-alanine dipeptidase